MRLPDGNGTRRPQACGCDIECAWRTGVKGAERAVSAAVRGPVDHRSRRVSRATSFPNRGL